MSARAAWRLEELGFAQIYDYVPSKIDWFANGLPREGEAAGVPWAGDLARDDAPTCASAERLGDVRERVLASGLSTAPGLQPGISKYLGVRTSWPSRSS